ncbi:hypothetical protein EDB19DRAFT_1896390 [Suillus lakei]|nr:hypothetical protein EDB19DRAFT_1896390 [Suillus lakei]
MLLEDPNLAMRPDFTLPEHEATHQQLINDGLMDDQAARQQHLCKMRQREEEEEDAARLEERKKNKNKYMPVVRGKVPSDPTILPLQYAMRKMKSGDYCKLHYFTNHIRMDSIPGYPAAAVKDPKAAPIVKDENLTWEEFNEAGTSHDHHDENAQLAH